VGHSSGCSGHIFVHQIPGGAVVVEIDPGSGSAFSIRGQPEGLRSALARANSKTLTKGLVDELSQGNSLRCRVHLCFFEEIVL